MSHSFLGVIDTLRLRLRYEIRDPASVLCFVPRAATTTTSFNMATKLDNEAVLRASDRDSKSDDALPGFEATVEEEKTYAYDDSRKLGVTGSVFLILNKMIGTGSKLQFQSSQPQQKN